MSVITNPSAGGAGGGMAIGGAVTGGTPNSVLYIGAGGVLAQDNAALNWNDSTGLFTISTSSNDGLLVTSSSTDSTAFKVANSSPGGHTYSFNVGGQLNAPGLFSINDFTNSTQPFAIDPNGQVSLRLLSTFVWSANEDFAQSGITTETGVYGAFVHAAVKGTFYIDDGTGVFCSFRVPVLDVMSIFDKTNPTEFWVANTDDLSGNTEYGINGWKHTSNVLTWGTTHTGTGSVRPFQLIYGGSVVADWNVRYGGATAGLTIGLATPTAAAFADSLRACDTPKGFFSVNGPNTNDDVGFALNQGDTTGSAGNGFFIFGLVGTHSDAAYGLDTTNSGRNSGDMVMQTFLTSAFANIFYVPVGTTQLTFTSPVATKTSIVASLPAAGIAGRRFFVTDATVTTFASIVAGTGTNKVPVYDDGTNWRIG